MAFTRIPRLILAASLLLGGMAAATASWQESTWFPLAVDVWGPPFAAEGERSTTEYTPLEGAERPWRLGVFIPHMKDAYWLGVNYGLVAEARRQGVALSIYEAGGYEHLELQRLQLQEALAADAFDGVILAAISADGLNDLVAAADDAGVPVIDLINGINSPRIRARAAASYRDLGYAAGQDLRARARAKGEPIRVAWFPGPAGAGWVTTADDGFRDAVGDEPLIEVLTSLHGDTGREAQAALLKQALAEHGEQLDVIVGTAVTAEAAPGVLRSAGLTDRVDVMAYYASPGVHRAVARGQVAAAWSDCAANQARLSVDLLVRILEGRDYLPHVGARIQRLDREGMRTWDEFVSVAPRGFRPTFSVTP